jgi:phage tail-like protein
MYPATGFHFQVVFQGIDDPKGVDRGFLSVGGLTTGVGEETAVLVLKRAVRGYAASALTRWLFSNIHQKQVDPLPQAQVDLLDENHQPYMSWILYNITPKSWELGDLHGERSEPLIETIGLYYERLEWAGVP